MQLVTIGECVGETKVRWEQTQSIKKTPVQGEVRALAYKLTWLCE